MLNQKREKNLLLINIKHLCAQNLPVALRLKNKVDAGKTLSDFDLHALTKLIEEIQRSIPLYNHHRESQSLAAKTMSLCGHIVSQALTNEPSNKIAVVKGGNT